nr:oxaloacetate decarboxylase [Sunxiuqinia sp.]
LMGKGGKLPGTLAPELQKLADEHGKKEFTANPQTLYPDALDTFRKEMDKNGWEYGQDDEELFELAMHPEQYRAYKSGEAKKAFEADLAKKREEGAGLLEGTKKAEAPAATAPANFNPSSMIIDVDGEQFRVSVAYGDSQPAATSAQPATAPAAPASAPVASGPAKEVVAPLEGKFYLTKESSEKPIKVGDVIQEGDLIGYVEAMKTFNAIKSDVSGRVVELPAANGSEVEEDDVLVKIQ